MLAPCERLGDPAREVRYWRIASRCFAALQYFGGYRRHSGLGRPSNSMLSSALNNEGWKPKHQSKSCQIGHDAIPTGVAQNDFH